MSVAEAVPRGGLPGAVAELLVQGECLLAVSEGVLVVAELGVKSADRVESASLPGRVAGGPVQVKGLPGVVERFAVADRGQEHGMFGGEPGQRRRGVTVTNPCSSFTVGVWLPLSRQSRKAVGMPLPSPSTNLIQYRICASRKFRFSDCPASVSKSSLPPSGKSRPSQVPGLVTSSRSANSRT